jgi:hypothetical protein
MAIYDQKCKLSKRTNRQISLALLDVRVHVMWLIQIHKFPPSNCAVECGIQSKL